MRKNGICARCSEENAGKKEIKKQRSEVDKTRRSLKPDHDGTSRQTQSKSKSQTLRIIHVGLDGGPSINCYRLDVQEQSQLFWLHARDIIAPE